MIEQDTTFHFWCMHFPGGSPKSTHRERRSASKGWAGNAWEYCVVVMHPSIHPSIPTKLFQASLSIVCKFPKLMLEWVLWPLTKLPTISLDPFYLTPQTSSRYFAGLTVATTKKRVVASIAAHITLSWPQHEKNWIFSFSSHYLSFMLHLYWIWKDCKHQLNLLSENTQLIFESYLIEIPTMQVGWFRKLIIVVGVLSLFFFFHV